MKIRTIEELSDRLATDLIWRKRELTDLKHFVKNATPIQSRVLIRCGIAILYAHWEGYVKKSGTYYLEFLRMQRLQNCEAADHLLAITIKNILHANANKSNIKPFLEVVNLVRTKKNDKISFPYKDIIATESNLSSRVLKEIINILGLDYSFYEPLEKLIDARLLGKRNYIAHGENESIDQNEFFDLFDQLLPMLEQFRTQIENAAILKSYRICP